MPFSVWNLAAFAPELILTVAGLLVLALDLLGDEAKRKAVPILTLIGMGAALLAVAVTFGDSRTVLGTMYVIDPMASFFKVVSLLVGILVAMLTISYLEGRARYVGEFYSLLIFVTLAMMLVVSSTDLILLYLSFEFLSITSYILVGWMRGDPLSNEASIKYFLYGAVASAVMLFGMSLFYGATGSTKLTEIAAALGKSDIALGSIGALALPALALVTVGFGFKIALVPFHQWSPDAYEGAPTPVTAFLSVGPKAVGLAILARVLLTALPAYQINWVPMLAGLSILTMTLGNLTALMQKNMKRLLAYSSIAHAGYMLIGLIAIQAGVDLGLGGLMVYILGYVFTNIGIFAAVIVYEEATGSVNLEDYAGLAKRAPAIAGLIVVFLLSLAGIPGTAGFIGKLLVFGAAIKGQFYALALIAVLNAVVATYYYINIVRWMFFVKPKDDQAIHLPGSLAVALVASLIIVLVIGLYPQPFINIANASVFMFGA